MQMIESEGEERDQALSTAADYWSRQTAQPRKRLAWGDFLTIRHHLSLRITGRPTYSVSKALLDRAKDTYGMHGPIAHGVSVGCGVGGKEIGLASAGAVLRWDCFEISDTRIAAGQKLAKAKGVEDLINFRPENAFEAKCPQYDLVCKRFAEALCGEA